MTLADWRAELSQASKHDLILILVLLREEVQRRGMPMPLVREPSIEEVPRERAREIAEAPRPQLDQYLKADEQWMAKSSANPRKNP